MVEEGTDAVCDFRREDVLELAGLLGDEVGVVNVQGVGEETLGETVTADDVLRAAAASRGEGDDGVAVFGERGDDYGAVVTALDIAVNVVGVVWLEFNQT
jgi:hypothetical protein